VREDVAADVALATLDVFDVGLHAFGRKGGRKEVRDVSVRVEAAERDELPDCGGLKRAVSDFFPT
jgi:hypothetical protein